MPSSTQPSKRRVTREKAMPKATRRHLPAEPDRPDIPEHIMSMSIAPRQKCVFDVAPEVFRAATHYAEVEGLRGAGATGRKALLRFLRAEGYDPANYTE